MTGKRQIEDKRHIRQIRARKLLSQAAANRAEPAAPIPLPAQQQQQPQIIDRKSKKKKMRRYFHSTTTTLRHACASSCRISATKLNNCRSWANHFVEICALPPRQISSTSNVAIGKTIVSNLQKYVLGSPMSATAARFLAGFTLVFWMICCDGAKCNGAVKFTINLLARTKLQIDELINCHYFDG